MSDERLLALTRTMVDGVRSGLPWAQVLRSLKESKLAAAAQSVDLGEPVHASLEATKLFPPIFIALVRAGEESGKIDSFLERFANALDTRLAVSNGVGIELISILPV